MAQFINICCPLCGLNRPLNKKGTHSEMEHRTKTKNPAGYLGRIIFGSVPLAATVFEDTRETTGGRGSGMYRVDSKTLEQSIEAKLYPDLIEQIYQRCKEIINVIESNKYREQK
ncbi:MAG: hypothetical protein AB1349_11680 [Elusimicrobiota bacterium]